MRVLSSPRAIARSRLLSLAALLLSALTPSTAAELVMRDLQAVGLVRPTPFDFSLSTPTLSRDGNDAFDAGTGLELGGRYSISRVGDPFGLILGLDATADSYSYDSQDFLFMYGARASVGAGYAFHDDWTATVEVGFSYGRSSLSLPESGAMPAFDADGSYRGYDARLAVYYSIGRQVRLSLQAGYVTTSHDLDVEQGGTLTLDQRGPYAGIGLTWRFSSDPERVQ